MKKLMRMALVPLLLAGTAACEDFGGESAKKEPGVLSWTLDADYLLTKTADQEIPDTDDFLLTILGPGGEQLYSGTYGNSPESMTVQPGSYTLSIRSVAFSTPAFSRPQYGDDKVVVVGSGENINVHLQCTLLNCGIKLGISSGFPEAYPGGSLYLKQDNVSLKYAYTEKRVAYFLPGNVSVILYDSGKEETLLTRSLQAREILSLGIGVASKSGGTSIEVSVDTAKVWIADSHIIGGDNSSGGDDISNAISVGNASAHVGEKGVWVYGYIVGGDLTANGASVKTADIAKKTHIAIAERSSVTTKASCVAVELPSGSVRDALNLVDNPSLIGKRVYVKGNIVEKYYGTTGLKGASDYSFNN